MAKSRADLLDELGSLRRRASEIEAELGDEPAAPGSGIERVRRALRVLSSVQEAIEAASDEATLWQRACELVVQAGAYRKAWVGLAEDDARRTVRPVAMAGVDAAYLDRADVVWSDTPRGRGPMGTAIRTGKVALTRDTEADPDFAPWRAAAAALGICAALALPLIAEGRTFGGLIVFAADPDAFAEEEIVLLGEVARSLGRARASLLAEVERRRAETRLDDVLTRSGVVAFSAGAGADRVDLITGAVEQVLGYSAADLATTPGLWRDIIALDDVSTLMEAMLELGRAGRAAAELRVRSKAGELRWVRVSMQVVLGASGAPERVEGVIVDINEQKSAERALHQMNAELEARVAERTGELRRANEALERASHIKDEFLAGMSHELRTPLNAVLGLSEALSEEVYGPITDRQRATIRRIEESGRHLLALINDILDLSKIEAGKSTLELGPVDVDDLCRASMRLVQEAARKKHLRIAHRLQGGFGAIVADERRLKQVLLNLLSNAVKFTPDGGQIGLDATLDEALETLTLSVWDSGIGMSPAELELLFQPFVQLDSGLARRHSGTGLGLALVRRLVDQHGGSVTVTSEPGRGSRFTVVVPAHRPAPPSLPPPLGRQLTRALIIDDSAADAEHLERYLAESGMESILHLTAAGAVDRAAIEQPDAIFLDILLPEEVGLQLLCALKADPRTAHLPVVVTSVLDRPALGAAAEVDDYILKPVDRARLAEALTRLAAADARRAARPAIRRKQRILVADDAATNVDTLLDFLAARGFEVLVARDGHEAVAIARAERPDLILMDIQMPHLDGLAATRLLREDPRPEVRQIPIVAVTALAMAGDRERCLEAGADDYLTKPIGLRALAALIDARLAPKG